MRFPALSWSGDFLAETVLRCLPPRMYWKGMQGEADETECPRLSCRAKRHRRKRKSGIGNVIISPGFLGREAWLPCWHASPRNALRIPGSETVPDVPRVHESGSARGEGVGK